MTDNSSTKPLGTNSLTRRDVVHLAKLSRIDLSDSELDTMVPQLDQILQAVTTVSDLDLSNIPATSHPIPLTNVSRKDEVTPSFSVEVALSGAPSEQDDRFRVPRILDED